MHDVSLWGYVYLSVGILGGRNRTSDSLELELIAMHYLMWGLGS